MKTNVTRTLLFSIIAMLSLFLMGSAGRNQIIYPKNNESQLQKIASEFQDIPIANRTAWNRAIANNPELLIRLSTSKLVAISNTHSVNK